LKEKSLAQLAQQITDEVARSEKSAAPIDLKPTSVDVVPQPTATTPRLAPTCAASPAAGISI